MTTQPLILIICAYSVALVAVVYFTRVTSRRVWGALVGGATAGLMALGMIALCEAIGWWRIPFASTPYFLLLLYLGLAVSCSPIYLITWRVARRFGWRGLAVFVGAAAVIGPPRDYLIAAKYPEWMVFCTGRCTHPRRCRDLCRYCGPGACRDAPCRRPRPRGPVGARSYGYRLTWRSNSFASLTGTRQQRRAH